MLYVSKILRANKTLQTNILNEHFYAICVELFMFTFC